MKDPFYDDSEDDVIEYNEDQELEELDHPEATDQEYANIADNYERKIYGNDLP